MRLIAHLSDMHFGRTDPHVLHALEVDLNHCRPDVIVVSGDLTQRAKSKQFAEARAFFDRLSAPVLTVPGNHDLAPLYRPLKRLLNPRAKFHKYMGPHAAVRWEDDEVTLMGLDSTRHLRWKSGKLRAGHLEDIGETMARTGAEKCAIAFLHHPPAEARSGHPYRNLAEHGIDLVLTGHVHRANVELLDADHACNSILVQASTACSTRLREDANGYALIKVAMPEVRVEMRGWSGERFHPLHQHAYRRKGEHWSAQ